MPPLSSSDSQPLTVYYVVQWTGRRHKRLSGPYLWAEAAERVRQQQVPAFGTRLTVEPTPAFDLDCQHVRDEASPMKRVTALAENADWFYGETTAPGVGCVYMRLAKAPVDFNPLPVWQEWARISISQRSILTRLTESDSALKLKHIAEATQLSASTVKKALQALVALGFVVEVAAGQFASASRRAAPASSLAEPRPEPTATPPTPATDWVQTSFA